RLRESSGVIAASGTPAAPQRSAPSARGGAGGGRPLALARAPTRRAAGRGEQDAERPSGAPPRAAQRVARAVAQARAREASAERGSAPAVGSWSRPGNCPWPCAALPACRRAWAGSAETPAAVVTAAAAGAAPAR